MMRTLFVLLPLASVLVVACDSDDESGSTTTTAGTSSGSGGSAGSTSSGGSTASGGSTSSGGSTASGGSGGSAACGPQDPDCDAVLAAFSPCGGDVTGTWDLTTACHVWGGPGPDPDCNDNVVEIATGPAAGTWVFDGSDVTVTNYQVAQTGHSLYSSNCASTPGDCATIEALTKAQWPTACCAMIDATTCECYATAALQPLANSTRPYSTNGNTLTLDGTDTEYCVNGNVLTIRYDGGTDDEVVEVFDKQ
jgi:hypothetical protein